MTQRTANPPKSQIEMATEAIMHDLDQIVSAQHHNFKVPIPEKDFRRILALYFENKNQREWFCQFGLDPPERG